MGPYWRKRFKSYFSCISQQEFVKLLLNFLPNGPHKISLGIFEVLKFEFLSFRFLTIFVEIFHFTILPYGEINNLNYLKKCDFEDLYLVKSQSYY